MVVVQKHIDLLLVGHGIDVAAATIDAGTAIDSNHTPITVSIPLNCILDKSTDPKYRSATRVFMLQKLDNSSTRNKYGVKLNASLAAYARDSPSVGAVDMVSMAARAAAKDLLRPSSHRADGKAVGIARHYMHKTIKVANYVKGCIAREGTIEVTRNMRQLVTAPEWARCPLPLVGAPHMVTDYLRTVLAAKKKASRHLDGECVKQERQGTDSLTRYSSLGLPKELAAFWRKLKSRTQNIATLSATEVINGVTMTYHNVRSILSTFHMYWAGLYGPTSAGCTSHRPWFHAPPPPIPAAEITGLTAPILMAEFHSEQRVSSSSPRRAHVITLPTTGLFPCCKFPTSFTLI